MKPFIVGNQLLAVCDYCDKLVRLNKPILGDLHFCLTEEERAAKDAAEGNKGQHQVTPPAGAEKEGEWES